MQSILAILPEISVLIMSCIALLSGLFLKQFKNLPYYFAITTLMLAALLTWVSYTQLNISQPLLMFHNSYIFDRLSVVMKFFIYLSVLLTFLYSRRYNEDRYIPANEFYVLALLSMLGMMFLVSSYNLLMVFLGVELLSLPVYAMVALQRSKDRCIEAAMKYFIIGALASGMLLYGISLLFGGTKSLEIAQIASAIASIPVGQHLIIVFGLVFLLAGIAFKLGAAPFHMWVPDVYDGAPSSVTLFLSSAPKLAAFVMTFRLLVQMLPSLSLPWSHILIVMALASMAIGNFAAIAQTNIKRMLAYSSIAHMGYMLLGLLCATTRGYAAAMFYILSYSIMTLGGFGMITIMARAGFEANLIEDFAGLNERNPWLAFIMMVIMFAMAGVPPLVGFIAKVGVIEALIQAHLVWLAATAVLFSIIGAYYYIRVIKVMYFERLSHQHQPKITYSVEAGIAITANGLAVLFLGIFPGLLFSLCHLTLT